MAFLLLALLETCLFCMEGGFAARLRGDGGCLAHIFCISEKWDSPVFVLETAFHSKQGGWAVRSKILTKTIPQRLGGGGGGYKEKSGALSRKLFQFIFSFMRMLMAIYMLAIQACSSNFSFTSIVLNGKGLTLVLV
jgi:hypothetical protein